jgi:uncharacterized protein YbaP (TraB family)
MMEPSIPAIARRLLLAGLALMVLGPGASLAADDCSASPASVVDLDNLLSEDQAAAAQSMPFSQGTLFKISRAGTPASYILGTLHLADGRLVAQAEARMPMVREARTVVLELKPERDGSFGAASGRGRRATANAARPKPTRKLSDLLRPAEIQRLKQALARRSIAPAVADVISPAALVFLLDQPTCEPRGPSRSMDQVISETARAAGREIIGLETLQEQLGAFEVLTREEARDVLLAALAQADVAGVVQDTSIRLYLQRKGGVLLTWTRLPKPLPALGGPPTPQRFLDELITVRNGRMADRLKPLLMRGGVFVAIGILHLPGEQGVLNRLKQDGYAIEPVE